MACVRSTAHECACDERLVELLGRFSVRELAELDRASLNALMDSIAEALERRERSRPMGA